VQPPGMAQDGTEEAGLTGSSAAPVADEPVGEPPPAPEPAAVEAGSAENSTEERV
jgi:hypothetical protein